MQFSLAPGILTAALLAAHSDAQTTATAHAYGYGGASCLQHNEDAQTNSGKTLRRQTLATNQYAYGFTAARALTIHGFAMFTRTAGIVTPFTMATALYPEDPNARGVPAATATATGSMTVAAAEAWYVTEFTSPVTVASGGNFWVSGLDSSNVLVSSLLGGDPSPLTIYFRRGTVIPWTPTQIVSNPGIVIICESTPILGATNTPKIPSTNFSIDLVNGPALSLSNMMLGVSNTTGPLGGLPTDLGLIGFTGTNLWCSMELTLNGFSDAAGKKSWPIAIPATTSLDGFVFYVQVYTLNTLTNAFGVSNAVQCIVGTL